MTLKLALTKITQYYIFIYLLSGLASAGMTQKACQLGQTFYDEAARKCRRCKFRKGFEFSMKTINKIPFDDHFGALGCPVCIKCTNCFYSSRRTGYKCIKCSTPCKELKKETLISCNGRRNIKCGACLPGYYSEHPQPSSFPCKTCSHTNDDRRKCQGYTTALPKLIQTISSKRVVIYGTSSSPPAEIDNANMKEMSRQWKWNPFIVSATVIICGVSVVLSAILYKKNKAVQNGRTTGTPFGSRYSTGGQFGTTGGQFGSTNSTTARPLLPIGGAEEIVSALDVDGCAFEEGLDVKKIMEDINLQDCKSLINTISAQIDRDPGPLFKELNMAQKVMFQAQEHLRDKSSIIDIREYVYSVLSRWIEIKGPDAKLSNLYEALHKCGFNAHCSIILRNLR